MRRVLLTAAALAAAVVVWTLTHLPPRLVPLEASWTDASVAGALHVHTNRSDGRSGPEDIAAAAARAGLAFVVFTDHGDATRELDAPVYRSGVLCIDAVEVSTSDGHYVVVGMGAAPYPLAGESRDVVEDVRRLGGFGIAAHPDSPREELQWSDWDTPIDGLELINPDTSWRVHLLTSGLRSKLTLVEALFSYPLRPSETIASLLTDSPGLNDRWATLASRRRVVGIAGVDAHAKLDLGSGEPGNTSYSVPVAGYEASFRTLAVHVTPSAPLTGDAQGDARHLFDGLRSGHLYSTVSAWAGPSAFAFTASNQAGTARDGDELPARGPVSFQVRSNAPPTFTTSVWKDDQILESRNESEFTLQAGEEPAVYRVEIRPPDRPGRPAWLLSNPIYVRGTTSPAPSSTSSPGVSAGSLSLFDGRTTNGWTTEADASSVTAVEAVPMVTGPTIRIRFGLSGGSDVGQFSGAAVETTNGVARYRRAAFTIRAEEQMRVSVQVRGEVPDAPSERWQRSIVVDTTDADLSVSFDDMRPVGATHTPRAVPESVRALMFIVDTTNTKPGKSGRIWLRNVRLEP